MAAEVQPSTASGAFAVTPSDTVNFTIPARALWVGGAGNVAVVTNAGTAVTFVGAAAGTLIPCECVRVNSTDTTATSIVALHY